MCHGIRIIKAFPFFLREQLTELGVSDCNGLYSYKHVLEHTHRLSTTTDLVGTHLLQGINILD